MFATILGAYPRTLLDGTSLDEVERRVEADRAAPELTAALTDELVREVIAEQEAAGLDLVSDGHVRHADLDADVIAALEGGRSTGLVDEWRFAAASASRTVKQGLPGPYSLGWRRGGPDRAEWTLRAGDALRAEIAQLAAAGCPFVEIEEPEAGRIGSSGMDRQLFRDAHARLVDGLGGMHLSLAFPGGEVEPVGAETLLVPGYASFAFDLIGGPDGWRIIARAAHDRGIVCGVMPTDAGADGDLALMVWAAHYAASTARRGLTRVGLSTAGGLRHLSRAEAAAKLARLAEAAGLAAGEPVGDLARALNRAREADHEGPDLSTATGMPRIRGLPGVPVPGRPPRAVRPRRTT